MLTLKLRLVCVIIALLGACKAIEEDQLDLKDNELPPQAEVAPDGQQIKPPEIPDSECALYLALLQEDPQAIEEGGEHCNTPEPTQPAEETPQPAAEAIEPEAETTPETEIESSNPQTLDANLEEANAPAPAPMDAEICLEQGMAFDPTNVESCIQCPENSIVVTGDYGSSVCVECLQSSIAENNQCLPTLETCLSQNEQKGFDPLLKACIDCPENSIVNAAGACIPCNLKNAVDGMCVATEESCKSEFDLGLSSKTGLCAETEATCGLKHAEFDPENEACVFTEASCQKQIIQEIALQEDLSIKQSLLEAQMGPNDEGNACVTKNQIACELFILGRWNAEKSTCQKLPRSCAKFSPNKPWVMNNNCEHEKDFLKGTLTCLENGKAFSFEENDCVDPSETVCPTYGLYFNAEFDICEKASAQVCPDLANGKAYDAALETCKHNAQTCDPKFFAIDEAGECVDVETAFECSQNPAKIFSNNSCVLATAQTCAAENLVFHGGRCQEASVCAEQNMLTENGLCLAKNHSTCGQRNMLFKPAAANSPAQCIHPVSQLSYRSSWSWDYEVYNAFQTWTTELYGYPGPVRCDSAFSDDDHNRHYNKVITGICSSDWTNQCDTSIDSKAAYSARCERLSATQNGQDVSIFANELVENNWGRPGQFGSGTEQASNSIAATTQYADYQTKCPIGEVMIGFCGSRNGGVFNAEWENCRLQEKYHVTQINCKKINTDLFEIDYDHSGGDDGPGDPSCKEFTSGGAHAADATGHPIRFAEHPDFAGQVYVTVAACSSGGSGTHCTGGRSFSYLACPLKAKQPHN